MSIVYRLITFFIVLLLAASSTGQSSSRLIKEADAFFERGHYREALQYYKQGGNMGTWPKETQLRVAISMYEINDLDGSTALLQQLDRDYKTEADVFLYLGMIYQHRQLFDQAARQYKVFIREASSNDPRCDWAKDAIRRCGIGKHVKFAEPLAYVENLGSVVNTFYDEYGPVPSPMHVDRFYFTSARPDSEGGLVDLSGEDDLKYGSYTPDMFFTEKQNGIWRTPETISDDLNSSDSEVIFGFSPDGQYLFYERISREGSARLIIDTFDRPVLQHPQAAKLGPFRPEEGDKDLKVFNDSIIVFASARPGGYGGYDLYYSLKQGSIWGPAANLGGQINTFYDESSPFLTKNGRKLFFSSNRLTSIGGMDVFETTFVDSSGAWKEPRNMGVPVNSAANEEHFMISAAGLVAYFSSNRKSGFGGMDLYAAYMRSSVTEHLSISYPISFIQLSKLHEDDSEKSAITAADSEVQEYYISDLAFETDDLVLTPQNIKKLEVITNLMQIYPTVEVEFVCHDIASSPESFNLYFSIKKAEQAADFVERKGINHNRIFVKGAGSYYPKASSQSGVLNPNIAKLNRRIEVRIRNLNNQPVRLIEAHSNIPGDLIDDRADLFAQFQDSLVFRVQIAEVNQLLQNSIFDNVSDALIAWDNQDLKYKYYIGMEARVQDAFDLRDDLRTRGFGNAEVQAFLDGKVLTRNEMRLLAEQYPQLVQLTGG